MKSFRVGWRSSVEEGRNVRRGSENEGERESATNASSEHKQKEVSRAGTGERGSRAGGREERQVPGRRYRKRGARRKERRRAATGRDGGAKKSERLLVNRKREEPGKVGGTWQRGGPLELELDGEGEGLRQLEGCCLEPGNEYES